MVINNFNVSTLMDVDESLLTVDNVKIVRTTQNKKWPTLLKELGAFKESLSFKTLKFDLNEETLKVKAQRAYCVAVAVATQKDYPADYSIAEELLKLTFEQDILDNYPLNIHNIIIKQWVEHKKSIEANVQPMHFPIMLTRPLKNGCDGLVATLTVWNTGVACGKNDNCWVPAPASYLLDYDDDFYKGLKRAQAYVQTLLTPDQSMPILVWDIEPTLDGSLKKITGLSASTTMAVAALSALRPLFEKSQSELYRDLGQINTQRAAISAEFHSDGKLTLVDYLPAKLKGIKDYNSKQSVFNPLRALYLASNQPEATTRDSNEIKLSSNPDINTLIKKLATDTNTSAIFGEWPNINEVFSDNSYHDFIGREWLINHINSTLADINNTGIICLVAPAGWGKTAFALHLAKQRNTNHPSLYVDGYGFVRREGKKTIDRYRDLTDKATTVIRQLNNCTRYHLNLKREISSYAEAETVLTTLLNDCSEQAQHDKRQKPIILLLDAADELSGTTITKLLPKEWPKGVVLIVTSRASGLTNITQQIDKSIALRTIDVTSINDSNKKDIEKYIQFRRDQIKDTIEINDTVVNAIINACKDPDSEQYFFLVAHGLLAERDSLLDDIKAWRENPNSLPKGIKDYINSQIRRSLDKTTSLLRNKNLIEDDEVAENMASFVLFLVAMSESAWPVHDLKTQLLTLKECCKENTDIDFLELFNLVEENLFSPKNLNRYDVFWQGYQDLFDKSHVSNYQTRFIHTLYRESILEMLKPEQRNILHKLWGLLCENIWQDDKAHSPDDDNLLYYALRYGPSHLAKGHEPLLAVQRLLDFRPMPQKGYLDLMYEQLKEEALSIIMMHLRQITLHNALISTDNQYWLTALDSLRFVLSSHDTYLRSGRTELLPTLYNAMAGYFDAQTELGKKLLEAISTYPKPWLKNLEPDAADAFGPIVLDFGKHKTGIKHMVHSEDGEWFAFALFNGEVWVCSKQELVNGDCGVLVGIFPYLYTIIIKNDMAGFVLACSNETGLYVHKQKYLTENLAAEKISNDNLVSDIHLISHVSEGYVVAWSSNNGAYVQTEKKIKNGEEAVPLSTGNSFALNINLIAHPTEIFVVAWSSNNGAYVQTKQKKQKLSTDKSINTISLIPHPTAVFVVAWSSDNGAYVQTEKRLTKGSPEKQLDNFACTYITLISHGTNREEFVIFWSSDNGGFIQVETTNSIEKRIVKKPLWTGDFEHVVLIPHATEGFVVVAGGSNGVYLQTQTRLDDMLKSKILSLPNFVADVAITPCPKEKCVVAWFHPENGIFIQTENCLTESLPAHKLLNGRCKHVSLIPHAVESFLLIYTTNNGFCYVETQKRLLKRPIFATKKNQPSHIFSLNLQTINEETVLVWADNSGALAQTQKNSENGFPAQTLLYGGCENIALIPHARKGFVVVAGGRSGVYLQTQNGLEGDIWHRKDPKPLSRGKCKHVTLIPHTQKGFIVVWIENTSVYIQSEKSLKLDFPPKLLWTGNFSHITLIPHATKGFIVAGCNEDDIVIQTQERLEEGLPAQAFGLSQIKSYGKLNTYHHVALIPHATEGFVVVAGGYSGVYLQTQKRLEKELPPECLLESSGTIFHLSLLPYDDNNYLISIGFLEETIFVSVVLDKIQGILTMGFESRLLNLRITNLGKRNLLVGRSHSGALHLMDLLDSTKEACFIKNILTHYTPNYLSNDFSIKDDRLRFYIAHNNHTEGAVISEYQLINLLQ